MSLISTYKLSDQQYIEVFHLLFLQVLKKHLDSTLYALKGGCNLRFFFESIRYSEDIDLDVTIVSKETLKKKIDNLLEAPALQHALGQFGIQIDSISTPKQTETVQRWKINIKVKNRALPIPTKIEFSRRTMDNERKSDQISSLLLQDYRLPPMILPHYQYPAAIKQKISALINRTETQARDVFDLHLLFSRNNNHFFTIHFDLEKASDCVFGISYNDFSSQVVSYLMEDYVDFYKNAQEWQKMQLFVIDNLTKYHHEIT